MLPVGPSLRVSAPARSPGPAATLRQREGAPFTDAMARRLLCRALPRMNAFPARSLCRRVRSGPSGGRRGLGHKAHWAGGPAGWENSSLQIRPQDHRAAARGVSPTRCGPGRWGSNVSGPEPHLFTDLTGCSETSGTDSERCPHSPGIQQVLSGGPGDPQERRSRRPLRDRRQSRVHAGLQSGPQDDISVHLHTRLSAPFSALGFFANADGSRDDRLEVTATERFCPEPSTRPGWCCPRGSHHGPMWTHHDRKSSSPRHCDPHALEAAWVGSRRRAILSHGQPWPLSWQVTCIFL